MKAQQERNDNIAGLIQTMQSTYSIVGGSEVITDQRLQDVLSRILKQTIDCGFFIQEYIRQGSFLGTWVDGVFKDSTQRYLAGKAVQGTLSSTDASITKYQDTFKELRDEFAGRIKTQTALVLANVSEAVNEISKSLSNSSMRAAR